MIKEGIPEWLRSMQLTVPHYVIALINIGGNSTPIFAYHLIWKLAEITKLFFHLTEVTWLVTLQEENGSHPQPNQCHIRSHNTVFLSNTAVTAAASVSVDQIKTNTNELQIRRLPLKSLWNTVSNETIYIGWQCKIDALSHTIAHTC
jgi:hypothetical protein